MNIYIESILLFNCRLSLGRFIRIDSSIWSVSKARVLLASWKVATSFSKIFISFYLTFYYLQPRNEENKFVNIFSQFNGDHKQGWSVPSLRY